MGANVRMAQDSGGEESCVALIRSAICSCCLVMDAYPLPVYVRCRDVHNDVRQYRRLGLKALQYTKRDGRGDEKEANDGSEVGVRKT
jgi:hypothetical protein